MGPNNIFTKSSCELFVFFFDCFYTNTVCACVSVGEGEREGANANEWAKRKCKLSVLRGGVSSGSSGKHRRHRHSPSRQRCLQSLPLLLRWPLYVNLLSFLPPSTSYFYFPPHNSFPFLQMTPWAIPSSSATLIAPSSSVTSLTSPPNNLFARSFPSLSLSLCLVSQTVKHTKRKKVLQLSSIELETQCCANFLVWKWIFYLGFQALSKYGRVKDLRLVRHIGKLRFLILLWKI